MTFFGWLDFQTTGSHERLDSILEVALIVTDEDLVEQTAITLIVNPALSGQKDWADRLSDSAKLCLGDNGLLRDISTGVSLATADDALAQTVKRMTDEPIPLCGINVDGLARKFLSSQLRSLRRCFSYRSVDVLTVRRFLRDVCGRDDLMPTFADADQRMYRALQDLQDTLSEARIYRTYIDLIPEGL